MLIECEHEGFFPLNLSKAVIYLPITKIKKIRLFVDNTNKLFFFFFFFFVNIKFKLQKFFFLLKLVFTLWKTNSYNICSLYSHSRTKADTAEVSLSIFVDQKVKHIMYPFLLLTGSRTSTLYPMYIIPQILTDPGMKIIPNLHLPLRLCIWTWNLRWKRSVFWAFSGVV